MLKRRLPPSSLLLLLLAAFWHTESPGVILHQLWTSLFVPYSTPQVAVPRLNYRLRTLPNGLTVCSLENHKSPTVAIQVWYRVGGKNDPEHKSGFAHLFEHLMFKGTRNLEAERISRLTEDVGGYNNASTSKDRTAFYDTVPSHYLETLLWAEADRMANLVVDESAFQSERAVVEEEYRQSLQTHPYDRMFDRLGARSFTVHPYQHSVIGSIADLEAATLEDVRRFHAAFYRPDNAFLVIAGDFDPAQCDRWVDRYFGRIPRPSAPIPKVTVKEPARTGERRFEETGPHIPQPAVALSYLVPAAQDPDAAALEVTDVVLSGSNDSLLDASLDTKVASANSGNAELMNEAGLFVLTAMVRPESTVTETEQEMLSRVVRLQDETISEEELMRAQSGRGRHTAVPRDRARAGHRSRKRSAQVRRSRACQY